MYFFQLFLHYACILLIIPLSLRLKQVVSMPPTMEGNFFMYLVSFLVQLLHHA